MTELSLSVGAGFVLESVHDRDADQLVRWLGDGEVASFIPAIPQPYGDAEARSWIQHRRAFLERHGREITFAVRDSTGVMVGSMGFDDFPVGAAQSAELGGWLAPSFRGQGLGPRCGFAITKYGFDVLGLSRITAHALADNERSIRFLSRLGFVREDLLRHVRVKGEIRDVLAFGLLPGAAEDRPH